MASGILVPQPGIKPTPPALETQNLNHWITRVVPRSNSQWSRTEMLAVIILGAGIRETLTLFVLLCIFYLLTKDWVLPETQNAKPARGRIRP